MNVRVALIPVSMLILLLTGCKQGEAVSTSRSAPEALSYTEADLNLKRAETIIATVCHTCHDPRSSSEDRLAPPLELIKRQYVRLTDSEKTFVTKMSAFIMRPTESQVEMHRDFEYYGLMDPLGYSGSDIQSIAVYIYRNELERPDWVEEE